MLNEKFILASYPDDTFPENLSAFQRVTETTRALEEEEVLIQVQYLSIDPVARVWVSGAKTYLPALKVGMEIPAFGVGRVVASRSEMYKPGDLVNGVLSWSSYIIQPAGQIFPISDECVKAYEYLSLLGPTGMTAYLAIKQEMSHLPKTASIVISSAAGATGIAFCQYARAMGFTSIVGIAGSPEKCKFVKEKLGCLECINYKTQSVSAVLKRVFPKGVDLYFDNIGQAMLEQLLLCMKEHSKVILCGATATYARWKTKAGVSTLMNAIIKRVTLKGILYFGQFDKLVPALSQMIELKEKHSIQGYETLLRGLDQAPIGLRGVYHGLYTGKTIIDLTSEPSPKL